jgi:RND family efflux transporter MFP subunit
VRRYLIPLFLILVIQGCSKEVTQPQASQPRVVQLFEVKQRADKLTYEFPATVSAVRDVDIKFEVSGRLIEANLIEGSQVPKGQVLAKIDPTPFERKVEEGRIRHDVAVKELKRIKTMHKRGAASQSMLDNAESEFEITKLTWANAKQDLSYCQVRAPFDAYVAERFIENNSYIRAGDSIATLQDRSELYVSFDIPERLMTRNAGNKSVEAQAHILGRPERVFDLHYVEHQTSPDPITQTYTTTFAINQDDGVVLTPGTRAIVKVKSNINQTTGVLVPLSALLGDRDSGFNVWLFDPVNHSLQKRAVTVNQIVEEFALLSSGVNAGDKVVSAAANQMGEGEVVQEYKAAQ